jgi:hypothetical protein
MFRGTDSLLKKTLLLLFLLFAGIAGWYLLYPREPLSGLTANPPSRQEADSFARKISELAGSEKSPSAKRVEFREGEVDAYVQYELRPLFPKGLKQVDLQLGQDSISASSVINFDEIETSANGQRNPLISALFRGEHTLDVVAVIRTRNGTGTYEITNVLLDQREIPKPLVDLLIRRYIIPKYPAAKPNTPFPLPYNIKKVDLLPGKAIVHQGTA